MYIIYPITVTPAMIGAGSTIAEPGTGETAWVSAASYTLGDERVRATTHIVYEALQTHTGRAALPEADPLYWKAKRPTLRFAPFDWYSTTKATATTTITFVISPGFFNALGLYGLVGTAISVSVKDAPGGSVIYSYAADLYAQAPGLYELLFTNLALKDKLLLRNITPRPNAELTVTVTAAAGLPVGIGMLNLGDFRAVIGPALWGGTQYGASAESKSFSYIKFFEDGSAEIKRRGKATDMRGTVAMPSSSANAAKSLIDQVLDVPVSCIAADVTGYEYLNVFGLINASTTAETSATASLSFSVRGFL